MNASNPSAPRVEMYDTTLRDGSQGEGVNFSLVDKLKIAERLDDLGFDYIEGGYPLSNPKDAAFFAEARAMKWRHAKLCAFGMTRRKGVSPADDPGMKALVDAATPVITIVGKTWDLHVDEVLRISREENLAMIRETVEYCRTAGRGAEVFYDCEHFFDGYRANPDYAMQTLLAAVAGGAARLVFCDTNGGSLPGWVTRVVGEVRAKLAASGASGGAAAKVGLGVHCHNDSGLAVANSLAAVDAGCVQVQGTINGIGERCGNVDLTTVAANLRLKMGMGCLSDDALPRLTEASRFVYERANLNLAPNQPFVGSAAFAHKGGMHVHAVQRLASSYEHISPELVGNSRRVLVSELSGASNIAATLGRKFNIADDKVVQRKVLERVQDLEHQGYQFEAAAASFELILHDLLGTRKRFWELDHYRCTISKGAGGASTTEGVVKLRVGGRLEHHVAEGDGPVNALDAALRKGLSRDYPQLAQVHLRDYKVRVVNPTAESAAKVRVVIDFAVRQPAGGNGKGEAAGAAGVSGGGEYFSTIGVSENIVEASWQALTDAFDYFLLESQAKPTA
ncbi:MAG: citramalate synthase [Planctomycetota bacterium]|nr:citramalate synthase [Planctomycetota bacterium]